MDIFKELQKHLKNNYINFISRLIKKQDNSFSYAMKNNKMTGCCTLSINAETEKKKAAINDKLKKLIIKHIDTPDKLVQYMKFNGLKVYNLKNADKLLSYIREEEGFITPQKGFEAFILNFILGLISEKKLNIKFSTGAIFIFNEYNTEIYTIARALHKYYGYKNKLPGFDYKSQKLFKKIYNSRHKTSRPFADYTIAQMYACKDAIQRDLESINFSIQISMETEGAKHALNKIKTVDSANV